MQSIIAIIFAFMALQAAAQYTNQSAPFYLIILSSKKTINGSALSACHEGAAIEALCLDGPLSDASQTYTFNTTANATNIDPVYGQSGTVNFELRGGNFNLSSPLSIIADITTNVAVPEFTPGYASQQIGFDSDNKMFVFSYVDNSVSPPVYTTSALYQWLICVTNRGYVYTTLAWLIGRGRPQNPSCQRVSVQRVFATV